jgi:hypothetical protein
MSRLNRLSSNAIKAMYGSETNEALLMLLTIYDPENPSTVVGRLANGFTGRLASLTTDQEIIYGVTSRSNSYYFLPMEITLPTEQEIGMGQFNIVLQYAAPDLIALIRQNITKPTKILLELVLSSTPDYVEATFSDFSITSVTYNAQQINLSLEMVNLSREPFPCYNFTPGYFPGLF